MSKTPSSPSGPAISAVKQIRRLLAEWLESKDDPRRPIAEILRLTEAIEDDLRAKPLRGTGKLAPASQGLRYSVDKTAAGEVLTEHRPEGGSPPFRVARSFYDAVAEVLAEAEEPL